MTAIDNDIELYMEDMVYNSEAIKNMRYFWRDKIGKETSK